jgi:uncharacterized membrane protein YeiB
MLGCGEDPLSKSESWKMWAVIIAILLFSGFVAAIWPLATGFSEGSSGGITFEPETIVITIPPLPIPGLDGGQVITLNGLVVFAIIAVLVIGAVLVVGFILAILNILLSRQTTKVNNSEKFQERNTALQQREKEKLAQKQEGRAAATSQQHDYSHWAVVATSLSILMFAIFMGLLFAASLFPSGQMMEQDQIINIAGIIAGVFFLVTLFILLLRMNPRRLAAVDETDHDGIPWDTIAVILLGVLVLGLGIGLVVFLNQPV